MIKQKYPNQGTTKQKTTPPLTMTGQATAHEQGANYILTSTDAGNKKVCKQTLKLMEHQGPHEG